MSEKSILNLLSSVAMLTGHTHTIFFRQNVVSVQYEVYKKESCYDSRSAVVVDAVDFPADEDADPAVTPLVPIGQQEGNQQSQT